jgi:hypothetical protein
MGEGGCRGARVRVQGGKTSSGDNPHRVTQTLLQPSGKELVRRISGCNADSRVYSLRFTSTHTGNRLLRFRVLGSTVYGLRFTVLGFTVYGLRFTVYGFRVYGLRFTVYGLRFTVYGLRLTVYGLWFTVYGLRFMAWGVGWVGAHIVLLVPSIVDMETARARTSRVYGERKRK